ncbi:polyhydroxyalkanoate synthesis repressor PhaR [Amylibacter marinus]|uniref:Polyhydroxyalkanoate synthesis repressor PhaR n=1 Tax=Amylibacter marinus TaxID=1475483 RepID=A0ABQ5VRL7_9RHOB|nr:polyhydroxyalkanoate synthesis repressor PhaR [Amylibacter marinus]GLQ33926.1 polyhydroxyalkanoate synthesis repressor PhaR [Amylibacter marinus]
MSEDQKVADEPEKASADQRVVIKKYANRRLYNTSASKYIVLQDVIELVNAGREFVIEDAKSGEDITRSILNQIIFEQETQPQEFLFPLEFQKQLIRLYGDSYGHLVPDFLTKSINFFASERKEMTDAWQSMMARNTDTFLKQSEAMARQNMEAFRRTWDVFGVMGKNSEKPDAGQDAPSTDVDQSEALKKLQAEVSAMQEKLKELK